MQHEAKNAHNRERDDKLAPERDIANRKCQGSFFSVQSYAPGLNRQFKASGAYESIKFVIGSKSRSLKAEAVALLVW